MLLSYFSTKSRNCKYTGNGASRVKRQFLRLRITQYKTGTNCANRRNNTERFVHICVFFLGIKLRTFGCQKYDLDDA